MLRLVLEYGYGQDRELHDEIDLGLVDFVEVQDGYVTAFRKPHNDEDEMAEDVWLFETDAVDQATIAWPIDGRDITENSWEYKAHRLNIMPE